MIASGTHDHLLVLLSIVIAAASSYTALDLASRVRVARGWGRPAWLVTAAVAMGGGIWSMHFVAMLAFSLPGMEVSYDLGLTILSLLIAVAVTGAAFFLVGGSDRGPAPLVLSGLFMGTGIAAMHYTGMAAMRMHANVHHESAWVAISLLIAIGASSSALWLAFRYSGPQSRFAAAVVMGLAISGMHYAAMRGSAFHAHSAATEAAPDASLDQVKLALAVASTTFVILFLASVAAMFDRRFAFLAEREAEALRRSEQHFRNLYFRTPLPLHFLDGEGRVEMVSDAWLNLLEYARDEVIGRPLISFMTEASARKRIQEDWPTLVEQGSLTEIEYRFVTKAGDVRDVVLSARAENGTDGVLVGSFGGLIDVTARKRAEEALRQAQKIEAVGQLTGGVAHDFNNLLAVVLGNLDMLRKRLPDDPRSRRLLENAVQGAQRGASLTQRMLSFARRQDLKPEAVNVAALVQGIGDLLQRAGGPAVRIDVRFPLHLPTAKVDANQLELALINLIVNARDAMPAGGAVTISARQDCIPSPRSVGLPAGSYICISVADSGEGMDEATLARAREPFFTTKGVGKGTGLGLSMVHGLAEQSGGQLLLTSQKGAGTTAEIWLPIAGADVTTLLASNTVVEEQAFASASIHPLTVLVVDDDPLVLLNTAEVLEDLGHTAIQATSGREALALLGRTPGVDVVITDQAMPEMTGVQLAAAIREAWPHLPIILASGYAEVAADAATALPRLSKPFSQAALRDLLGKQVSSSREGAQVIRFPAGQGS